MGCLIGKYKYSTTKSKKHFAHLWVINSTNEQGRNRQNQETWILIMSSEVPEILQREILDRCNAEEREAVERWFKSFQAIGLSKRNGMSVARGTTMSCPLY